MARAEWRGSVLAQSDGYELVEGNVYFPPESVRREFLRDSQTTSDCPWKGRAKYHDVVVEGEVNKDAAWHYPNPKPAAAMIKGYVAFGGGIDVLR